jgi:hypothetical protein
MTDGWRYTEIYKMFTMPKKAHLFDKENRMKICQFIDKYVTRQYGTRMVSACLAMYKDKIIFNIITMSDISYMGMAILYYMQFYQLVTTEILVKVSILSIYYSV